MELRLTDVELVLEHVPLPRELAEQLGRSWVKLEMSDEQLAALNDACIAYVQERGFDSDVSRRVESIVDALNQS
jgi:hypothetical protein